MTKAQAIAPPLQGSEFIDVPPIGVTSAYFLPLDESVGRRILGRYCFGNTILEVQTDAAVLLKRIDQVYGACRISEGTPAAVTCDMRSTRDGDLIQLTFLSGAPNKATAIALALLHPLPGQSRYQLTEFDNGWSQVDGDDGPVVLARGPRVLVDTTRCGAEFLVEFLVSVTLLVEQDLVALHAAGLGMGDRGVLLTGSSRAGKTTTAMTLAACGHRLLGDELTLLRLSTSEIVPLPRAVKMRGGPRTPALAAKLTAYGLREGAATEGWELRPFDAASVFSSAPPKPVKLRSVFFLNGFANQACLARLSLTLNHGSFFDCLSANDVASASWGLDAATRTLRLLALRHLLCKVPCWLLTVGPPAQTAKLIERQLEQSCC